MGGAQDDFGDLRTMEAIIQAEDLGHLGLIADGEVYVVPINYTYAGRRVLMHCALEGRKLDLIRANPSVCFTVARQEGRPSPHAGDICDNAFESVICWGQARVVEDPAERRGILEEFQSRYDTSRGPRPPVTDQQVQRCGAIEVRVSRMTGRRGGKHKESWSWEAA